jgi:hypothetical protein
VIAGRALLEAALTNPLAWAAAVLALALTAVWLVVVGKLVPRGLAR